MCNQFEVTQRGSRHCGSGTIELAEECDDGNLVTGDGCSADCRIEQCWTCNGAPSTCAPQAGGTCDDSDPCTTDDRCTGGGTCVGAPLACEPCFACTAGSCVPATQAPCKASVRPDQSFVLLQTSNNDNRDRITWTWKNGAATAVPELGDPPGGDGYTLCVYDESGPAAALVFRATVPGGGACQTGPCWRPTGKTGFKYGNVAGTPDGVLVTRLIPGDVGKARVELRAKGAHLSGRPYGLPMVPPPMPLRVQLHSESGLCVETRHDAGSVVRNDVAKGLFRARGIP